MYEVLKIIADMVITTVIMTQPNEPGQDTVPPWPHLQVTKGDSA